MMISGKGRSVSAAIVFLLVTAAAFAQVPASKHVVLVIDENSSFSDVRANMPWLVGKGDANGYAANYESDNGGSLLDYLWLASGSCESKANCTLPAGTHDFNCNGNDCYYPGTMTSDPITDDNIFRELNKAGISWKVYAQSYDKAGGKVTTPDNNNGTSYYRRHNGAVWYSDILSNVSGSASKVVDLSQLTTDLNHNALPRFMIIVPDGNHDAHDCPVGMSRCTEDQQLAAADAFLSDTVGPILSTSDFQPGGDGLLLVTFDECGGGTDAGCGAAVYTALIGPKVKPHTVSNIPYKHENALRTMLESLGITTYPGASATAAAMSDFFENTTESQPDVTVTSPASGETQSSPVTLKASAVPSTGRTITGWWVYVDSVGAYNAGAVSTIAPKLTMKSGQHTIVVRAWDTSGAYGDQTLTLTVGGSGGVVRPQVALQTPTKGDDVGSPVNVQASATPTAGNTMSKWSILVDGADLYNAGAVTAINTNVNIDSGSHRLVVRAWDTSGMFDDRVVTITVNNKPAVSVSAPAAASDVSSPIHIEASAIPSSGHTITGWWVYEDSVGKYNGGAVDSISPSFAASAGTHTLVIRAWDTSGAYGDQTIQVTVK